MGLHQQRLLQRQPELSYRDLYYPGSHRYAAASGAGVTHAAPRLLKNDVHLYKAVKPQRHPDVIDYVGGRKSGATSLRSIRELDHSAERRRQRRLKGQHRRVIRYRGFAKGQHSDGSDDDGDRNRRSLSRRARSYASSAADAFFTSGEEAASTASDAVMLEPAGVALIAAVHQKSFNSVAHRPVAHGVEETLYYAVVNVEQHGLYMTQVPGFPKSYY